MRILLADDHYLVRRGLKEILLEEYPNAQIGEVADADSVIVSLVRQEWDLVISDVSMPGRSGLEMLQQIRQSFPRLPVLIVSVYPEEQYAPRVLKAGASGYLNKDLAPEVLIKAVRLVTMGRKYITPLVAELLLAQSSDGGRLRHELLSDREFDVFRMLAAGMSIVEIAEQFKLSATTISTYRSRVMSKMSMNSNADIVRYAIANGLV
jgi:two-component system, NarL family, invasion response regulator UvrY